MQQNVSFVYIFLGSRESFRTRSMLSDFRKDIGVLPAGTYLLLWRNKKLGQYTFLKAQQRQLPMKKDVSLVHSDKIRIMENLKNMEYGKLECKAKVTAQLYTCTLRNKTPIQWHIHPSMCVQARHLLKKYPPKKEIPSIPTTVLLD